ncbi:hypothetical protein RUM43_008850 [Polyplax serrata]|uniref:RCC1-like domain-containing protein n=1 Tax=Polyplax serrata TaxID=468196 RepID=A0AAN8S1M2_POLSC
MSTGVKRHLSNASTKRQKNDTKKAKISIIQGDTQQKSRTPGLVLTFGQGDVGQLGLGPDIQERGRPTLVKALENVVDICAGGMHTVCLNKDGNVYTFGCDDEGALGREATDENSFEPGQVVLPGSVVQVTAGDSHSAALLEDGRVFAWGSFRDSHGAMGLTAQGKEKRPIQLLSDKVVTKIASGADHLVMLTNDGQLYTCGCAEQGQLGRVSDRFASRESRQGLSHLLLPGRILFNKRFKYHFVDVWATSYCTFAKEKTKGIFAFGLNNYNQLGLLNEKPQFHPVVSKTFDLSKNWKKITGGQHHTLALEENGKVYVLGRKEYGRLGLGKDCGDAKELTLVPTLSSEECIDIACGSSVSFAVTKTGVCYAWGMGSNCQLGMGDDDSDIFEPSKIQGKQLEGKNVHLVSAGGQHTVILVQPSIPNGSL